MSRFRCEVSQPVNGDLTPNWLSYLIRYVRLAAHVQLSVFEMVECVIRTNFTLFEDYIEYRPLHMLVPIINF